MAKKEEKGLYVFSHPNKFLTIAVLGVQFVDGRFETDNKDLAQKVFNYDGVEVISQP